MEVLNGQIREGTEKTFLKLRATAKISVAQTNYLLSYKLGEAKKERRHRNEQRQRRRMDMQQQQQHTQQKGKRLLLHSNCTTAYTSGNQLLHQWLSQGEGLHLVIHSLSYIFNYALSKSQVILNFSDQYSIFL